MCLGASKEHGHLLEIGFAFWHNSSNLLKVNYCCFIGFVCCCCCCFCCCVVLIWCSFSFLFCYRFLFWFWGVCLFVFLWVWFGFFLFFFVLSEQRCECVDLHLERKLHFLPDCFNTSPSAGPRPAFSSILSFYFVWTSHWKSSSLSGENC